MNTFSANRYQETQKHMFAFSIIFDIEVILVVKTLPGPLSSKYINSTSPYVWTIANKYRMRAKLNL